MCNPGERLRLSWASSLQITWELLHSANKQKYFREYKFSAWWYLPVYKFWANCCYRYRRYALLRRFLAHLAKGHVSFSHHLASVVVVVRRPSSVVCLRWTLSWKSSPLKLLNRIWWNLVKSIFGMSTTKGMSDMAANQKTWPPLLKIEYRGQEVVLPKMIKNGWKLNSFSNN